MAPAALHGDILLRPDGVSDGRALEWRADIEAPKLLELVVVIGDHPAVLKGREHKAAGGCGDAGADFNVGHGLRDDVVAHRVIGSNGAVIEIARIVASVAALWVTAAVRALEPELGAVLAEAAFRPDSVGNVLLRVVGGRLMGDAAVPGRAGALHGIAPQGARLRHIGLHVEARIVFDGLAGLGIKPLGPVEVVGVLAAFDEAAIGPVERIEKAVAGEMAYHLAPLAVDGLIIEEMDADLVVIPRVVRQILVVPNELAGIDVERHGRVGVEIVPRAGLRVIIRGRIAGAPNGEPRRRIVGPGLPDAAASGLPGVVLVFPGLAARIARLRNRIPAPQFIAGAGIERREPTANGLVGDDDFALDRQRRGVEMLPAAELVGGGDALVPHDLAAVAVDADDPAVRQVGNDEVLPQRDAAGARRIALMLDAGVGDPHEFAVIGIAGVDLVHRAPAVGGVHEAVVDQRVDLVFRPVLPDILHTA